MSDDGDAKPRRTLIAKKTPDSTTPAPTRATTGSRSGPRAKFAQARAAQTQAAAPTPPKPPSRASTSPKPPRTPTRTPTRTPPPTRTLPPTQPPPPTKPPTRARTDAPRARATPAPRPADDALRYFAPCPRGLEAPLQAELHALGLADAQIVAGGVRFTGDLATGWRVNLHSRIASRVLRQIAHAPYRDEHDVHALARGLAWTQWFAVECTIKVEVAARNSPLRSLEFAALRVKDAVCDVFRDATGARPDVDTSRPDVRIHLFLDERFATLYLDTSGEALFKRGWRHGAVDAPLRENLAVGLLALAGWHPGEALVDPFCGSGTLAIEAAQIAQSRAPGAWRHFSFERFNDFDATAWASMRTPSARDDTPLPIVASDVSQAAVDIARGNAKRAGTVFTLDVADARTRVPPPGPPGLILGNPPYGERAQFLDAHGQAIDVDAFWRAFADQLKAHWNGWRLGLITSDFALPERLNMTPSRKFPLYNGAIECRLFLFSIGRRAR